MSLGRWHGAILEMIEAALLQTRMTRDIARKAGLRPGTTAGEGPPDIWGSFTLIDANQPLGYTESFVTNAQRFFPKGLPQMTRFADWSNCTQARLLLTVTSAGVSGSKIGITGDGLTFAGGLSVPLTTVGVQVSEWTPVTKPSGEAITNHWMVENPNLLAGQFGVGLCQLQVRGG